MHSSSILNLQVYALHKIRNDKLIGVVTEKVEAFLDGGTQKGELMLQSDKVVPQLGSLGISRNLLTFEANGLSRKLPIVIEFDIASTQLANAAERSMHNAVASAASAHDAMKAPPAQLGQVPDGVEPVSTLVDTAKSAVDPWVSLVSRIKVLTDVVDEISEVRSTSMHRPSLLISFRNEKVHPYAKAAWTILSATYKVRS